MRLLATHRGYRSFATNEPGFFSLMFGMVVPEFRPSAEARAAGRAKTFGRVVEAAQACLDAGTLQGDNALLIAGTCWAATHGLASLEANAIVGVDDAILDQHQADKLGDRLLELDPRRAPALTVSGGGEVAHGRLRPPSRTAEVGHCRRGPS